MENKVKDQNCWVWLNGKHSLILLSTNSKKRIEGTVMGWQIPVPYKLPMILKIKLMIPEQSSDQDGLRN